MPTVFIFNIGVNFGENAPEGGPILAAQGQRTVWLSVCHLSCVRRDSDEAFFAQSLRFFAPLALRSRMTWERLRHSESRRRRDEESLELELSEWH